MICDLKKSDAFQMASSLVMNNVFSVMQLSLYEEEMAPWQELIQNVAVQVLVK